jgi:hypothetical protein
MKTRKSFSRPKYLFVTAFDHRGNHFESLIGIKTMRSMRRNYYSPAQSQFVFLFLNDHFGAPVNDLNIVVKMRSLFSQLFTQSK